MSLSFTNSPAETDDDKLVAQRHANGIPNGISPELNPQPGTGPVTWFMGGQRRWTLSTRVSARLAGHPGGCS
jgi:hypothetical protein